MVKGKIFVTLRHTYYGWFLQKIFLFVLTVGIAVYEIDANF